MGLINSEDIAAVRDRARLDDVVGDVVVLRSAGGGNYKGLCPFHDERSPSFHVTPEKGFWHCFGCGEGGDVIDFVRRVDGLSFVEAVESLAGRVGVTLRYEDADGGAAPPSDYAVKRRLAALNDAAAARFHDQLMALPVSHPARVFLSERGFDESHAAAAQVGFASAGGTDLQEWLMQAKGASVSDLLAAGLTVEGARGTYDRFRGRLMWPIRDAAGTIIGFGGRRLLDTDNGPKYLNTPETVLYKKSHVLYGLDVARKHVASEGRVVIVEGYTDVMACRAAGIRTAVATCGTAFGPDHVALLRRVIGDDGSFGGEIVFTFDGDEAGQKAALRSFDLDSKFTNHTFVAVEPSGADPCDVRLARGNDGLRQLVNGRVPLFEFVLTLTLNRHDLTSPEGRAVALEHVTPILAKIRDVDVRRGYERRIAERLGISESRVDSLTRQSSRRTTQRSATPPRPDASGPVPVPAYGTPEWVEREALKCVIQFPWAVPDWYQIVEDSAYLVPQHLAIHRLVTTALTPGAPGPDADPDAMRTWLTQVMDAIGGDTQLRAFFIELSLEPVPVNTENPAEVQLYALRTYANLVDENARRTEETIKGVISTLDPTDDEYGARLDEYQAVKDYRKSIRDDRLDAETDYR